MFYLFYNARSVTSKQPGTAKLKKGVLGNSHLNQVREEGLRERKYSP